MLIIVNSNIIYGAALVAPNGVMLVRNGALSDTNVHGNWQADKSSR